MSSRQGTGPLQAARRIARSLCAGETRIEALPGRRNPVFRLRSDSGTRILKLPIGDAGAVVRKEQWLTALLADRGLPVATIEAADVDGEAFGCPYLLMRSAGEETVAHWLARPGPVRADLIRQMGVALGRVHAVSFPAPGEIGPDGITPVDPADFMRKIHQVAAFLASRGLLEQDLVRRFVALELPRGEGVSLCHSDFRADQCIVSGQSIAAIVDWESAWAGDPAVDLAIAHAHMELTGARPAAELFLAGYQETRALAADYASRYLPVRMACLLGLIRVWASQGAQSWERAVRHRRVQRALALLRDHGARLPA